MNTQDRDFKDLNCDQVWWHKSVLCLVMVVIWLIISSVPSSAKLASIGGTTSCSTTGCHPINASSAVDQVAVKPGASAWETFSGVTSATVSSSVNAGDTIELEWVWTNLNDKKGNVGASVAVPNTTPTAWSFTPNTNAGAGSLGLWHATYQSTTWYGGATPTALTSDTPATHTGYATDYTTTSIANLNTAGLAIDNPGPDGQADRMGAKVSVTVPGDTPSGNYTIKVHGVGHVGNSKQSKITTLTINVQAAADTTDPSVGTVTPSNVSFSTYVDASFDVSANITEANTLSSCEVCVATDGTCDTEWAAATVGGSAPDWTCSASVGAYANGASLTINVRGTDGSANTGTGTPVSRTVDAAAPATTDNAPAGWQTSNPTVTLTPTDGGSGVADTQYCIDTTNTCTPGTSGTSAATTIGPGAAGTQYIRYRSTDNVGNVEAIQSTGAIQVDRAFPSTTDNAPAGWQDADVTVTLTPSDTGSGVANTQYCIDTSDTCTPSITGTSASVTQGAGTFGAQYVRYRTTDNAGNVEAIQTTGAIQIDKTLPSTTDNAPAGWQTSNPTVTLSPTDTGSGVADTQYCVDTTNTCTPGTSGTTPATTIGAGAAGTQYIRYRTTDNAGNVEAIQSTGAIQVDRAFPSTTDNAPAGWQSSDVTVTLTPSDTGSGLADTEYCIDTTNTCTPSVSGTSASVTQGANTEGTQYVRYRSTDNAGNVETTQSTGAIEIDKKGPTDGTLTVTPGNTVNGLSWTAASDAGSDLRTGTIYDVRFLTGGTAPSCATGTSIYTGDNLTYNHTSLTNDTQYSYRVCAYDNVDNVSSGATGSGTPTSGNSNPSVPTNLAQFKNDGTTSIASDGYTNETTVKIEADISDPDGGDTVKLQVDIDSNGSSDCESSLAATPQTDVQVSCSVVNGNSYDWQVRTVDNNGATSAWVAFTGTPDFTVDTTAPSVSGTNPADSDTDVALDSNVTITFINGPILCSTVNTTNITSTSPGWTFSSCNATQAVFTTSGQANSTSYDVNVTTNVTDEAGNALSAAYPFSYTTVAAGNSPPTDITLTPDKVTDGTDTSSGFDMTLGAIDPDGGETFTFTETGGADSGVFTISGNTLTLTDGTVSYDTPNDANSDRVYEVQVQVEDSASNTYSETLFVTITPAYNPMIHSSLSTGSSKWPTAESGDTVDGWGIANAQYGEFTCGTCHQRGSSNIKRVKETIVVTDSGSTDEFPIETAAGTTVFNSVTGPGSFGDDGDSHTSSDRVCEGCHSKNKYHNYDTTNNTGGFSHENQKDCISCHKHSRGFGASCDTCHGNPPITADTDGSTTTGMVHDPSPTDATNPASPGAHELHAVTEAMACVTCHKGNTMPTVSMTVQMGFEASNGNWSQFVGYNAGGNLDAPNEAGGAQMSASYEFVSSDGGATTITKVANNDLNCTVYCHGNWPGSGGSNMTPSWVAGSGETACGACHGATAANPPTAGSHTTHASSGGLNLACVKCHPTVSVGDSTHINGSVAWELATSDPMFGGSATYDGSATGSTGAAAQGVAYSQCTNVYCHAPGTPTWGGTVNCGDCHKSNNTLPDSHPTHYGSATTGNAAVLTKVTGDTATYVYQCGSCHNSAPHSDGSKDVIISANWDLDAVGTNNWNGTDTCTGTYCHSDGVGNADNTPTDPVWATTTMSCSSCHKAQPTTARHAVHTSDSTYNLRCYECHAVTATNAVDASVAINNKDTHVDTTKDVDWGTLSSGGTAYVAANDACDGLYCHSDGQGGAPNTAVQWDTATSLSCTGCHDGASAGTGLSGSHEEHIVNATATVGWNLNCHECHDDTTQTDNSTLNTTTGYANHVDSQKDIKVAIDSSACSDISCHSNGNFGGTTFAYQNTTDFEWGVDALGCDDCHGNGSGTAYPTYADGGIGEDSNSHATHISGPGYTCEECHNTTATGNNLKTGGTTEHVDQTIDVAGTQFTWTSGTETCSNIACHFNNSAQWGDTLGCNDCHGNPPNTNAHLVHAGSGAGEYGFACGTCHPEDHDGSTTDITFTGVAATWGSESYTSSSKTCTNLYCHGSATADWDDNLGGACGDCHGDANGRPDGTDEPSGGSHLTTSHQVGCDECHSHNGNNTTEHVNGDTGHTTGDALVSSAGASITSYTYGSTLASSPDPDGYKYSGGTCANSCHGTLDWGGTATCDTCHNGSGSGYSKVSASSPHSNNATGMTCEGCHFSDHGSRTTGTVGINWYAQTMGTDYTVDGKIYIKANGATTEAEACWSCHIQQSPIISEWDGSSATYDYGSVDDGTAGNTVDDLNWFTTNWSSANFDYKNGKLTTALGSSASTHGTEGGASGVDQESEVSCTRCHDVHAIGNNGYTAGAAPYLRGTWVSSPYYEDGAPGRYTGSGGSGTSTYLGNGTYGIVPRASAATTNGMGGYWIDQNSGSPANGTYANHAGLCTLCHGDGDTTAGEAADVSAIETLWIGHKNTVAGGNDDGSAARNIFSTSVRIGNGVWNSSGGGLYMGAQNTVTYRDTKGYAGSIRNADYGDGVSPTVVGKAYAFNHFAWGVSVDGSSVDSNYHSFSCSKCHNPHASRLPKLMITNCLDVRHNLWDDAFKTDGNWSNNNYSSMTYGTNELSQASTAQNCHRYISGQETAGWNSVTPW